MKFDLGDVFSKVSSALDKTARFLMPDFNEVAHQQTRVRSCLHDGVHNDYTYRQAKEALDYEDATRSKFDRDWEGPLGFIFSVLTLPGKLILSAPGIKQAAEASENRLDSVLENISGTAENHFKNVRELRVLVEGYETAHSEPRHDSI